MTITILIRVYGELGTREVDDLDEAFRVAETMIDENSAYPYAIDTGSHVWYRKSISERMFPLDLEDDAHGNFWKSPRPYTDDLEALKAQAHA